MDIVIDSSAIVAVVAKESTEPALVQATKGHVLIAPISVHYEIGNAFAAMFKRKRLTLEQVLAALKHYESISIRYVAVELEESLRIAHTLDLYAYDAYLVYTARQYRIPLLTLDRRLRDRAMAYGIQVLEVSL